MHEPLSEQPPACTPCRVLVVDDEEDTARTFAAVLEMQGHEARALTEPKEVLRVLEEYRPDLVFMDIGMPELDGWQLARMIRERYPPERLRLVAVTAYGAASDFIQSRKAGFDAHVVKPANAEAIKAILRTVFPTR